MGNRIMILTNELRFIGSYFKYVKSLTGIFRADLNGTTVMHSELERFEVER